MRFPTPLAGGIAMLIATVAPAVAEKPSVGGFIGLETLSFTESGTGPTTVNMLVGEFRIKGSLTDSLGYDLRLYGRKNLGGLDGGYFDPTVAKLTWQNGVWQIDAGYDLLFWGVAESRNVVNIINQRDQIRDVLNDQGLGQPMVAVRYFGSSYAIEGFVLPGFRELDFGTTGRRWGFGFPVDDSRSTFDSDKGRRHVDYALRLAGSVGNLEYGLSAFDGTLRQPRFNLDTATGTLVPRYVLGRQFGLELQYTTGAVLLKLEAARVLPDPVDEAPYWDGVAGVEYLPGSVFNLPWETTFFAEYNWDSRGDTGPSVFQDDLFLGTNVRFGNVNETELRLGVVTDLEHGGILGSARLSTRLGAQLRLEAEYIFVDADDPQDALFEARDLDQLSVSMQWHF